jgi:hypothetical protein
VHPEELPERDHLRRPSLRMDPPDVIDRPRDRPRAQACFRTAT